MINNSKTDNEMSLHNVNNYNKTIHYSVSEISNKYIILINEYLKFVLEKTKFKNIEYFKFIIVRGYDTITNVFNHILYYTKNLSLAFYQSQKAYYYYVEFIEQISEEHHTFLQLTSRDAITYVYKKIFLELHQDSKEKLYYISNELDKLKIVDENINIFTNVFNFIIQNLDFKKITTHIDKYKFLCEKIVKLDLDIKNYKLLYNAIENINQTFYSRMNINDDNIISEHYELIINLIKKYSKQKK